MHGILQPMLDGLLGYIRLLQLCSNPGRAFVHMSHLVFETSCQLG
jgi:hypothetical protein